jgi:hypothetical protein
LIILKNKHYVLLFFATLAIGLSIRRCDFGCGQPFRATLFDCDTSKITEIIYAPFGQDSQEITWTKNGSRWFCTQNGHTIAPKTGWISTFFENLTAVSVQKIVSRSRDDWKIKGISENLATRISWVENGRNIGPFFLSETPENGVIGRLPTGDEVYQINQNFLFKILQTPFNSLKNKELCRFDEKETIALAFNYPNQSPVLLDCVEGSWQTPGGTKTVAAIELETLFRVLKKVENNLDFAENFGEMDKSKTYSMRLMVTTRDSEGSFVLVGYRSPNESYFVVNSSQNPENYFRLPDSLAQVIFANPILN